MKRLLALLLVSTLAFSFASTAQTVKKFTVKAGITVRVNDGLTTAEITTLTTTGTYDITTTGLSDIPTTDDAPCNGTINACSLYILFPDGCTHTDAQVLAALNTYLTSNGWPGCGTAFNIPLGGHNHPAVFFCKNS